MEQVDRFWFIETQIIKNTYEDAFDAITVLDLWDFIRKHRMRSFLLHPLPIFRQLYKLTIKNVLLSDNTYEMIMHNMKYMSVNGYNKWEMYYIKRHRPDLYVAGKTINRIIYDIYSNPNYKKGRQRIEKMFKEINS